MYGLVTWSSLGRTIGVSNPTIDAVIHLISALHQKDYFSQAELRLERFGLSNLGVEELNSFWRSWVLPSPVYLTTTFRFSAFYVHIEEPSRDRKIL